MSGSQVLPEESVTGVPVLPTSRRMTKAPDIGVMMGVSVTVGVSVGVGVSCACNEQGKE